MRSCGIDAEQMVAFCEGRADPVVGATIERHLADGCQACQSRAARLGPVLDALRGRDLETPPEHILHRARELFRRRQRVPSSPRATVLARLLFDSRSGALPAFARGGGGLHAVYTTDAGTEIDLWQERNDDGTWSLLGQLVPPDEDGPGSAIEDVSATDTRGDRHTGAKQGNEISFTSLAAGIYQVVVDTANCQIVVDGFQVGPGTSLE